MRATFLVLCFAFSACQKPTPPPPSEQPSAVPLVGGLHKVEVQGPQGETLFAFKWRDDGAEMQDAAGHDGARFKLNEDRLKIRTVLDEVVGFVTGDAGNLKVKDANKTVLFEFKRQDDGDYKLQNGSGTLLFKFKLKEGAVKVVNAEDGPVYKAKRRETKIVLRTEDDKDLLTAKHGESLFAASILGLTALTEVQRQALFVRITQLKLP